MVEEHRLDQSLQEIHPNIVTANMCELMRQDPGGNEDDAAKEASDEVLDLYTLRRRSLARQSATTQNSNSAPQCRSSIPRLNSLFASLNAFVFLDRRTNRLQLFLVGRGLIQ